MRYVFLILLSFVVSLPGTAGPRMDCPQCVPPDTMDLQKVLNDETVSVALRACWPTEETIKAKKYNGNLDVEVADLLRMLRRVVRQDYLPSESEVKQKCLGLLELWDGDDYLLLEYETKSGFRIRVQDGKGFYLLVRPPARFHRDLSKISSFVEKVASMVLNLPTLEGQNPLKPRSLVVFQRDVGKSKVGKVQYGPEVDSPYGYDWYSRMSWWSDGRQVLFGICKMSKEELAELPTLSTMELWSPRRFASRVVKPSIEDFVPIDTIDMDELRDIVEAHRSTWYIIHALQPTQETTRVKRFKGPLDTEVNQLWCILRNVLREEYLPSESAYRQNVIGLVDLWGGNDYLLLSYVTKSGLRVDIKDGKRVYLLVTLPEQEKEYARDIPAFVKRIAVEVLALPAAILESTKWPMVVSEHVLRRSEAGSIKYGSPRDWGGSNWDSSMRWWSDGKRVLFETTKIDWEAACKGIQSSDPGASKIRLWDELLPRRFISRPLNSRLPSPAWEADQGS